MKRLGKLGAVFLCLVVAFAPACSLPYLFDYSSDAADVQELRELEDASLANVNKSTALADEAGKVVDAEKAKQQAMAEEMWSTVSEIELMALRTDLALSQDREAFAVAAGLQHAMDAANSQADADREQHARLEAERERDVSKAVYEQAAAQDQIVANIAVPGSGAPVGALAAGLPLMFSAGIGLLRKLGVA